MDEEGWGFSDDQFKAAFDEWLNRFGPAGARRAALINWCLAVMENGPPKDAVPHIDPDSQVVPDEPDTFTFNVPGADATVTYLVVESEKQIAIWEIWG
jgi:hypothetical protein